MRKLKLLPLLAVLLLAGCIQANFFPKFEPTVDLKDRYDHSVKDEHITVYYSMKGNVLHMAVQNTGNIYMQGLTVNYDECCQQQHKGPGAYNYKNLGNLKNRSYRNMDLMLPSKDVQTVRLKYSFTPVQEDSFMRTSENYQPQQAAEDISGSIVLYIGD